ncbi:hypothetical protein [Arthrobacter castelli]|uniref:hypothetical protein n=1 Tax=Arthrobacter castelli TaxID=271431 RepID=UPI0003F7C611|nr:hypothetical protein [Arthrobacter castelli]
MDISLNSSAILVIIVGLWLVWVVPYFLRRPDRMPAHQLAMARNLPAVTSPSQTEDSRSQGNILENTSTPSSSSSARSTAAAQPAAADSRTRAEQPRSAAGPGRAPGPFKIRYGRTALAGLGAAALLVGVVCAIISIAGLIPAYIPVVSLLVAVGSVAALRALAVRDRTKRSEQRIEAAFREAMNPGTSGAAPAGSGAGTEDSGQGPEESTAPGSPGAQGPKRETKLFDAENPEHDGTDDEAAASVPPEAPQASTATAGTTPGQQLTADDLRQAALAVAAESDNPADQVGDDSESNADGANGANGAAGESTQTWEPVHVPKPKYVESAKADRPAPEPLELPAEPKPEGKPSIKAGAVAPKVEMKLDQEAVEQTAHKGQPATTVGDAGDGAAPQDSAGQAKLAGGLHDLDNVLQRRRA